MKNAPNKFVTSFLKYLNDNVFLTLNVDEIVFCIGSYQYSKHTLVDIDLLPKSNSDLDYDYLWDLKIDIDENIKDIALDQLQDQKAKKELEKSLENTVKILNKLIKQKTPLYEKMISKLYKYFENCNLIKRKILYNYFLQFTENKKTNNEYPLQVKINKNGEITSNFLF